MAHPYKDQANATHKAKTGNMGKTNNLDIPIMRAVGENKPGKPYVSSTSMQHKAQSGADGMKRGGHVGKPKHSKPKPKITIAAPAPDPATSPSLDPALAAAGAGSSPAPAPPMMPPPGAMPPPGQPPMKRGGKVMGHKYTGGADSGMGRLQKSKTY